MENRKLAAVLVFPLTVVFSVSVYLYLGLRDELKKEVSRIAAESANNAKTISELRAGLDDVRVGYSSPQRDGFVSILERSRNSVCYIYTEYKIVKGNIRIYSGVSGTGFVARKGIFATNRHVVEPWFEDKEGEKLVRQGGKPKVMKLIAFCPTINHPIELFNVSVSQTSDLGVACFELSREAANLVPLPLGTASPKAGESVMFVGYASGIDTLIAKSPDKFANLDTHSTLEIMSKLASFGLVRPSATYGHIGDVVADKMIYDAAIAKGASGGPLINIKGEVVGVVTGYIENSRDSNLGYLVESLYPLLNHR